MANHESLHRPHRSRRGAPAPAQHPTLAAHGRQRPSPRPSNLQSRRSSLAATHWSKSSAYRWTQRSRSRCATESLAFLTPSWVAVGKGTTTPGLGSHGGSHRVANYELQAPSLWCIVTFRTSLTTCACAHGCAVSRLLAWLLDEPAKCGADRPRALIQCRDLHAPPHQLPRSPWPVT